MMTSSSPPSGVVEATGGQLQTVVVIGMVLRLVWDWVINCGPVRFFSVPVHSLWPRYKNQTPLCTRSASSLFTFGVSLVTLGVVPNHTKLWRFESESRNRKVRVMVGANQQFYQSRTVVPGYRECGHVGRVVDECVWADGRCDSENTVVWEIEGLSYASSGVNHRWWVLRDNIADESLVINLHQQHHSVKDLQRAIRTPFRNPCRIHIFMNHTNGDEAVFVSQDRHCVEIIVSNLGKMWSTQEFSSISITKCLLSGTELCCIGQVLVLKTQLDTYAFIVMSHRSRDSIISQYMQSNELQNPQSVHHYKRTPGQEPTLSQLSESLYCVSTSTSFEIWDCNSPNSAIRVIDNQSDDCNMIVGHTGFLFQIRDDSIIVSEYTSGVHILRLPVLSEYRHEFASIFSFMSNKEEAMAVLDVRTQFLAACMSTHKRCGRVMTSSSPSSGVAEATGGQLQPTTVTAVVVIGTVLRLVWDWVINCGPVRFFSVPVYSRGTNASIHPLFTESASSLFTFGVSLATLGVVPNHTRSWRCRIPPRSAAIHLMIGANQHLYQSMTVVPYNITSAHIGRVGDECVCGGGSGASDGNVAAVLYSYNYSSGVNHKWWVIGDNASNHFRVMLLDQQSKKESIAIPFRNSQPVDVFMNQVNHDEAVFVSEGLDLACIEITVANLDHLWSQQVLGSTTTTRLLMSAETVNSLLFICPVLVLKTQLKRYAFVVLTHKNSGATQLFQCLQSYEADPNLCQRNYGEEAALSQLSESLYCVSHIKGCEIWDCNNTHNAIRAIDPGDCCQNIVGHSGFLLHVRDDGHIAVTDYASGAEVLRLLVPRENRHQVGAMFSFIL
ncbi:hypothetical protein Pelo_4931 [Pelomyxa schiedti]|nr:hypothetical protein Pelo_4931 [Pelomyxa schiedti]